MKNPLLNFKTLLAFFIIAAYTFPVSAQEQMQYFKPYSKEGVNIFETAPTTDVPFKSFHLRWGGAFTQQFQALDHSHDAGNLINIGPGFNTAAANLNLDLQLADGIRVNLITYLSSRHHPEAWVKGGYLQVDRMTILNSEVIDRIMENLTLRIGHFEINYGDAHFRRTDNAQAMHNPFVGNYIMDAFTTEIGTEIYYQNRGFLAMAAMTNGELQGRVTDPDDRSPSIYGKLGFDRQLNSDLRFRLTGSAYSTSSSISNTLYGGDRAGSRYHSVMVENGTANNFSGRFNPGMRDKITAVVINPFVKLGGFEFFGNLEQATGRSVNETDNRTWNQYAGEVIYRFLGNEQVYVGGRYNLVSGELMGSGDDVSIDRIQIGGGWFVTSNILVKTEFVNQTYRDFPAGNGLSGGNFKGFMLEGVVAF